MKSKLLIVSDLHFEFHVDRGLSLSKEIAKSSFDTLIVAGDLSDHKNLEHSLKILCEKVYPRDIIYVMGNHEMYGSTITQTTNLVDSLDIPNLNHLNSSVCTIGDQRFIGTTLWFKHDGSIQKNDAYMNDFHQISDLREQLSNNMSRNQRNFLFNNISEGDIVVTHHLPHPNSIHPMYAGSDLNQYFMHDVSDAVEFLGAKLWIHGHTHLSCDYTINKTRVFCNPFGYAHGAPREPNANFNVKSYLRYDN